MDRNNKLGQIRPPARDNGQEKRSPGLGYGSFGNLVVFRDWQGNEIFLEAKEGGLYIMSAGYTSQIKLGETSGSSDDPKDNFSATQNKTAVDFQPADCAFATVLIQNNQGGDVQVKLKQADGTYIIGSTSFPVTIPANKAIAITNFAGHQVISANPQDVTLEVVGTGKDLQVFANFTKFVTS